MTIKQVEQILDVPRATVRFYEKEGLICPQRGENGYREYSEKDVEVLKQIIILRKLGFSVSDIEDVLDGVKPLSEVVKENISNLKKQVEELQGPIKICQRLQETQEELETFDADKYWKVIEEEEHKGNRFLDIARDVVHFEKATFLEYFGIADVNGNLSVSIPRAIISVLGVAIVCGCIKCLIESTWNVHTFASGIGQLMLILLLQAVVGLPIYLIGKKNPRVAKNRTSVMLGIYVVLLAILVLIVIILNVLGVVS